MIIGLNIIVTFFALLSVVVAIGNPFINKREYQARHFDYYPTRNREVYVDIFNEYRLKPRHIRWMFTTDFTAVTMGVLWGKKIYLQRKLFMSFPPEVIRALLLHEVAHFKKHHTEAHLLFIMIYLSACCLFLWLWPHNIYTYILNLGMFAGHFWFSYLLRRWHEKVATLFVIKQGGLEGLKEFYRTSKNTDKITEYKKRIMLRAQ